MLIFIKLHVSETGTILQKNGKSWFRFFVHLAANLGSFENPIQTVRLVSLKPETNIHGK